MAATATHVHVVHHVSVVRELEVAVVVIVGEKSRAKYVHPGHRRCERSLARSVAVTDIYDNVVKADVLTHPESRKMA